LRAVAVGLVVAYHAGVPGVTGGFIGVDVFFVISGFLITRLLLDDAVAAGRINLGDFYARRVRRILPALVVVVLFTMAAMPLVSFNHEQVEQASASAVATIFFYSNVFFWSQAESYFAPQLDLQPLLHTWSLAIEEQFYMVWPLALTALTRLARRFGWSVTSAASRFFVAVLMASLAFSIWSTGHQPIAAFYLMPSRAWELATGALLAVHAPYLHTLSRPVRTVLRLAGLAGIAASAFLLSAATAFPGVAAILPVLSTALVVASVEGAAPGDRKPFLSSRPMVFVGLLSYSWYLWHWPLLAMRRLYFLGDRTLGLDLLVCAAALVLAYLTYRYVETPVRTMRFEFLKQQRWTFALGAGLCVAGFVAAQAAVIAASYRAPGRLAEAAADSPPLQIRCNPPGPFRGFPTPDSACTAGAPGAPIGVVVWGDSHAGHLLPMAGESLRTRQLAVLQRTRFACPPMLNATPAAQGRVDLECVRFNDAVIAELAERRRAGLRGVILNSRWTMFLTDPAPNPAETSRRALTRVDVQTREASDPSPTVGVWPHDKSGSARTMEQSLRETFDRLRELGLSVMVVAPTPEMHFLVPQCLARRREGACLAQRSVVDERRAPALAAIRAAAAGFAHVTVWDPIERFCDEQYCFVTRDGIVMYIDENHFTASWSRRLASDAEPVMAWLIRDPARTTPP
jgi:peptidoglycan/LPS O-acetylase OafA/YrhL